MLKYIKKGWIAKDIEVAQIQNWVEVNFFSRKPKLIDGVWDGDCQSGNDVYMIGLDDLKLNKGECRHIKITIEEIK